MLEFMMTMAVMALVFCVATVFVAFIAGGLLKLKKVFSTAKLLNF